MLPELKFRPSLSGEIIGCPGLSFPSVAGTKVPALIERGETTSGRRYGRLVLPELKFRPSLSALGVGLGWMIRRVLPELKFRPSLSDQNPLRLYRPLLHVLPELKFRPSLSAWGIATVAGDEGGVAGTKVPALIERRSAPSGCPGRSARVAGTKVPALIERVERHRIYKRRESVLPELKFRPSLSERDGSRDEETSRKCCRN